jgi:hypothetical protein
MYRPDRGWGFSHKPGEPTSPKEAVAELEDLRHRIAEIEAKLEDRAAELSKGQLRPAIDSPGPFATAADANIPKTTVAAAESQGALG